MAYFFKHDDNARRDPKLVKLRRIKGMKGIGIYWCLIEILHEQEGEILFEEINSISFELQEDENNVLSVIKEFGLFVIRPYGFGNTRVLQSLEERHKKSKIAKNNIKKRWSKNDSDNEGVNTTVLPKTYSGNTIREEKRRETTIVEGDVLLFEVFRKSYPGTKRGLDAELSDFKKQADYKSVIPVLSDALNRQISARNLKAKNGAFVPQWKNLKTWLHQKCWTEEIEQVAQPVRQMSNL